MKTVLFPGQGAQRKGMGKKLFEQYPAYARLASDILGYSIEELCLEDPRQQLNLTQYTQPALYVVSVLEYSRMCDAGELDARPHFLAGHSLGEFAALTVGGAFDFQTGLQLVEKRGKLMASAGGGKMLAVVGLDAASLAKVLADEGLDAVDLANYNSPKQHVLAGQDADIEKAYSVLERRKVRALVLNVSAPFHSRYMRPAQEAFAEFLRGFAFLDPTIPVIANVTARPYERGAVAQTLAQQVARPVRWTECIQWLIAKGDMEFVEAGSTILTRMVSEIRAAGAASANGQYESVSSNASGNVPINVPRSGSREPLASGATSNLRSRPAEGAGDVKSSTVHGGALQRDAYLASSAAINPTAINPAALGSARFRADYGVKYAYLTGAMVRGIASKELVVRMGKAGLMGYFGSGGLSISEIEEAIVHIQRNLAGGSSYGMNLLCNLTDSDSEMEVVSLYLRHGVSHVEAAAFMQARPALVWYRLSGLRREADGSVSCRNKILAKISRPEVAEIFMSPAPGHIVQKLLEEGRVTREQALLAKEVPLSHEVCLEADSGGHTDMGISTVLMPVMMTLRERLMAKHGYQARIHVGMAGGIGTPEAAAAAFMMGADFILTGSINQCTVEAGISDAVKDMLQTIHVQDTAYAPAGDMFEIGAKVQVLKKGVFFPARANKLYSLYTQYGGLEEIPLTVRKQIEERYFKKSFDEVWEETKRYFVARGLSREIQKAQASPKHKMALVFRWYFGYSLRLAFAGDEANRVDFQIHTGPALGAFNQWVEGTELETWRRRHVDELAEKLMSSAATLMASRYAAFVSPGRDAPVAIRPEASTPVPLRATPQLS